MTTSPRSSIPAFGLGTFRLKDQAVIDSVRTALDVGYRAIDTAQIYRARSHARSRACCAPGRRWLLRSTSSTRSCSEAP